MSVIASNVQPLQPGEEVLVLASQMGSNVLPWQVRKCDAAHQIFLLCYIVPGVHTAEINCMAAASD